MAYVYMQLCNTCYYFYYSSIIRIGFKFMELHALTLVTHSYVLLIYAYMCVCNYRCHESFTLMQERMSGETCTRHQCHYPYHSQMLCIKSSNHLSLLSHSDVLLHICERSYPEWAALKTHNSQPGPEWLDYCHLQLWGSNTLSSAQPFLSYHSFCRLKVIQDLTWSLYFLDQMHVTY